LLYFPWLAYDNRFFICVTSPKEPRATVPIAIVFGESFYTHFCDLFAGIFGGIFVIENDGLENCKLSIDM